MKLVYARMKKYGRRFVTISETSKNDMVQKLGIKEKDITIVGTGYEHMNRIADSEEIFGKYPNIHKGKYYYAVGNQYPYKNFEWVRQAAKRNPDSQFVDLDKLEPNYDDDYYDSIAVGSNYAAPSEDDFNLIFAKPKKPKVESANAEEKTPVNDESAETKDNASAKIESRQSELGFSSGLDVKGKKTTRTDGFNKAINDNIDVKKGNAPKKPVDKTRGGLFARGEIENATVVLSEDVGEMVGIDGKVYGPFLANDVVILPNITAQILIDNNKASLVKY